MGDYKPFPYIEKCSSDNRENQTVVSNMDGTLLHGRSSFPYFALVAFEAGGVFRLLFLLLLSPLAGLLYCFISEAAGLQVLIFATSVGMRVTDVESVARAVLPKFYATDLQPQTWRVFSAFGRRCVLTAIPRIMVEAFLKDYLGVDTIIGTEISTWRGRATGLVSCPGMLVEDKKVDAMRKLFGEKMPDVGLGGREADYPFMKLCQVRLLLFYLYSCFLLQL